MGALQAGSLGAAHPRGDFLPDLSMRGQRAKWDTGSMAGICTGTASTALSCHAQVAHLAPSAAGLDFVPAPVS